MKLVCLFLFLVHLFGFAYLVYLDADFLAALTLILGNLWMVLYVADWKEDKE